jgi:hypothetical protein
MFLLMTLATGVSTLAQTPTANRPKSIKVCGHIPQIVASYMVAAGRAIRRAPRGRRRWCPSRCHSRAGSIAYGRGRCSGTRTRQKNIWSSQASALCDQPWLKTSGLSNSASAFRLSHSEQQPLRLGYVADMYQCSSSTTSTHDTDYEILAGTESDPGQLGRRNFNSGISPLL